MERGGDEELEECLRGYKAWNLRKQITRIGRRKQPQRTLKLDADKRIRCRRREKRKSQQIIMKEPFILKFELVNAE
jgi:hypothetical protein